MDTDNVRRPVSTLTRENRRSWFKELKYWLIGENIFFVVEKNLEQYASETLPQVKTNIKECKKDVEDTRGYAAMKDQITKVEINGLNEIKEQRWVSVNAKVLFTLSKCIDQFNRELLDHFETAREHKSSANSRKQDLHQITSFKFEMIDGAPMEMTIPEAWAHLLSARGRKRESNPSMAVNFTKEVLLEYFLNSLPLSHNTILQAIDANPNQDVYEKLEILERNEKIFDLNANLEGAHAARTGGRIPGKSKSRQRGKDSQTKILCHFFEQEHLKYQCELRRLLMAVISEFKISNARESETQKKTSHAQRYSKGSRDFAAKNQSDHDSEVESPTDSCDEDEEMESCQYSKDKSRPCKIPESDWCSDSGWTTDMTGNPALFRGPITRIKNRTIMVGGGKLYAEYMGQVEMKAFGTSLILENVLLVPGLG
ncbi:hypothetical protein GcM1_188034 [Golovinomyces cichoracearum]|uniref:Retrovirus-related Pol polyprotein from transposon TNT 1-94-like beta-barrel domain-containing protein n=1 Tax=Golovinomyces cichoracearum TaxID=62708 RepID=A0A420J2D4_9PEZI|nr:hypothetical protein GcM1_188034 [Golovinomyces cichoracearum]